ncbi:MAG: hypothetical protein ACK50I_04765, partial [Burkholderiales bacterium]
LLVGILPALTVGPLLAVTATHVVGGTLPDSSLASWPGFSLPLLRSALPVALVGFCAAVASGTLLFVANAGELLANRAFVVKVALLMFAGLNAAAFHASAAKEALRTTDAPGPGMRAAGAASLLLWASVIVAGRLIAYV